MKVISKYFLAGLLVSIVILVVGFGIRNNNKITQQPETIPPTPELKTLQKEQLYLLINAYRDEHELSKLQVSPLLEASSQLKLSDMLENHYYRHQDVVGQQSWHFFKQANYQYLTAGENLAFRLDSAWQVLTAWQESPEHRKQLLEENFEDMGLAIDCESLAIYADGGCITVLHLGSK